MINGKKLKAIRESERWSMRQLAKQIGITGATIKNIEDENYPTNTVILKKICQFFNVSADYLLDLKETKEIG